MKIRIVLMTIIAGMALAMQVTADDLLINKVDKDRAADGTRPDRGMQMDAVLASFGEPVSRQAPVGDPPIARWEYADYIVYFEGDTVLHSVKKRQPDKD